jgi:hypothetical protein
MWAAGWVLVFFLTIAAMITGFEDRELYALGFGGLAVGIVLLAWRARPFESEPFLAFYASVTALILFAVVALGQDEHLLALGLGGAVIAFALGLTARARTSASRPSPSLESRPAPSPGSQRPAPPASPR